MSPEQEIFEKTVRHLHEQGGPALGEPGEPFLCVFLTKDGRRKCALGFWVDPSKYYRRLEGYTAVELIDSNGNYQPEENGGKPVWREIVRDALNPIVWPFPGLMRELEIAHDGARYEGDQKLWSNPWHFTGTFQEHGGRKPIAHLLYQVARKHKLNPDILFTLWPKEPANA